MVNGVTKAELEKHDGGHLEQTAEVDDFGELFAGEIGERCKILGVGFFVPRGDFRGGHGGFRNFYAAGIEDAVDDRFEEKEFGGGDVAEKFVGGFGAGIGLVGSFVGGDGFQDFFGGAAFGFHGGEEDVVQQEVSLFGGDVGHFDLLIRGGLL